MTGRRHRNSVKNWPFINQVVEIYNDQEDESEFSAVNLVQLRRGILISKFVFLQKPDLFQAQGNETSGDCLIGMNVGARDKR